MVNVRERVSLKVGINSNTPAELFSFNGLESGKEHIALIFKDAEKTLVPLVRIHFECLTGDVFHSSRCDCGEQLDEIIENMAKLGGIILYLRQEGRGIGLYNKIDAYKLQSQGVNIYEANNYLGFDDDFREFSEAAQMLAALGIKHIRLVTNNPNKILGLQKNGINIVGAVGTKAHLKEGNKEYLKAKVSHGHHRFNFNKY
ncbi:GTP cyclohydrolase-2 [Photobacterium piscicola]|uniref:GTP cyclohydrolase II n=1 Tax=Photobacterium piscicola TaxID=1378299 RepID=A0A1T5HXJ5_9GAMM|nr:GTP cyclohydrolase II [Photobacterium piscicola]SKC31584.1 GTP cyclohydrolase-2 [Photobacterium piscicola]